MSSNSGRRAFLRLAGSLAALSFAAPFGRATELLPKKSLRVVIVGGGFGGAIAAKTLRMINPEVEVILVERNRSYTALPGTNWFIGGSRRIGENRWTYDLLEGRHGVRMLYADALSVDPDEKKVIFAEGFLTYDFAVVAPGVDFRFQDIPGYVPAETPNLFPHAWGRGEEVAVLRKRLEEMKNGGVVAVALPLPPYRCPQAAYERVSQIACYLKQAKPRSKIIVVDASPAPVALENLFPTAWSREYPQMIEYRGGQSVLGIDAPRSRLDTAGESLRPDVVNLIPPQAAGLLAHRSGLVGEDKRWCPINHATCESTQAPGVYVIGDACLGIGQHKSASAANAQGKACALAISASIGRRKPQSQLYSVVIYSLLNDKMGASSVTFVRGEGSKAVISDKGGGTSAEWSELEATFGRAWLEAILAETST